MWNPKNIARADHSMPIVYSLENDGVGELIFKIILVVQNFNFNNDVINGDTKMCCSIVQRNPTFKHTWRD